MNSDSRPDSVLDEQENTSEPPETPLPESESKEPEDKLVDPLSIPIAEPLSVVSSAEKEENPEDEVVQPAATTTNTTGNDDQETEVVPKQEPIEPIPEPSNSPVDEKPNIATLPTTTEETKPSTPVASAPPAVEPEVDAVKTESSPPPAAESYVPKDQEMLSTIANIKQEVNPSTNSTEFAPLKADIQVYIKKEPSEEAAENSNSNSNSNSNNSNSNSNEPNDLKLVTEIKAEEKCGLDLTDHENKFQDVGLLPSQHIKYNTPLPPPVDFQVKYNSEPAKYNEPFKYAPHDLHAGMKYPPVGPEQKYNPESSVKYDMKMFMEPPSNENSQMMKAYPTEPTDLKYPGEGHSKYTPPISEPMKFESIDHSIIKRPPYPEPHQPMRSPYDSAQMMKYGDPMHKFHGIPPPVGAIGPPEMKYLPPADLKYRPPDNLSKSQFSADSLMKSNSYGDYPSAIKYPPVESPLETSARSTPNQDSQSSNSNMQQPMPPHHGNLSSPQTNSPHLNHGSIQSGPPLLMGPGGPNMPPHHGPLSHLQTNHPSMIPPNSSPSATPVSTHSTHHLPPSTTSTSMSSVEYSMSKVGEFVSPNLISSVPNVGPSISQVSNSPMTHPALHRPHQDIPPLMHHPAGAFSAGLLPSHSNTHGQIPPPALSVSRGEHERNEQRRMEGIHLGASPGLLAPTPGSGLLAHSGIPLHLSGNLAPTGLPLLPPHHPGHLGPPLMPPSVSSATLPLIGGPPISSVSGLPDGRRTPTSAPPSSSNPTTPITSSAFSRTSPSVQFSSLPPSSHRTGSPSQPPSSSLTRGSPLHLSHHSSSSALSAAAAAAAERDRQNLMRQQSPHMTPPPVSTASLIASPLSKIYGPPSQQQRSSSPPPHHLRPGASPPVIRHPTMSLPLPLGMGPASGMPPQISMHPSHNPYSHHLIHPMFYTHQHNPFQPPYSYHPYAPPGFPYMKPPPGPGMDPGVLPHHPTASSRLEETAAHAEKQQQLSSASSQSSQHKVLYSIFTSLTFHILKEPIS